MLKSLYIKNFAIIDELGIEFGAGLNVMTGETGAGKTVIIEALKLILGARAQTDQIRSGSERASVTAVFDAKDLTQTQRQLLIEQGIGLDDELIIHRVIGEQGKGRQAVGGIPVTTFQLKIIGENLVDVGSQHEHQRLADPSSHRETLDSFGGLEKESSLYREIHGKWSRASKELDELIANETAAKEKLDFLKYQLSELKAANLKAGEDLKLEAERTKLKHASELLERTDAAKTLLYEGDNSSIELLDRSIAALTFALKYDDSLGSVTSPLAAARSEIEETARSLSKYISSLDSDPARLEETQDRIHVIRSLARKHGGSIEACLAKLKALEEEINKLDKYDDIIFEKKETLEKIAAERREIALKLTELRQKNGTNMSSLVEGELAGLSMTRVKFSVHTAIRPENEWDERGPDEVEFLISPNPGEPLRPLAKIASGGELSRVMLALKAVLSAGALLASTSVFDEVDAGIGGAVAEVVGRKLAEVAERRQVICITHLPQVAAFGKSHMRISKEVKKGRTIANIKTLSDDERVNEIARMAGGEKITKTAIAHAVEMLKNK